MECFKNGINNSTSSVLLTSAQYFNKGVIAVIVYSSVDIFLCNNFWYKESSFTW